MELAGGVVVVEIGQQGHGPPHIADQQAGGGPGLLPHVVGEVDERAPGQGVGQIPAFEVGPLDDEQGAGGHRLGVAGDQRHRPGQQVGGQGLGRGEQAVFLQKLPVVAQRANGEVHVVTSFVGWSPQGGRRVGLRRDPADTPK